MTTERVTIITDLVSRDIAASIAREVERTGAAFNAFVLEDLAPRPLTALPAEIAEDLETSQISIFAVQVQTNELRSRMQMTEIVNRRRIRHAIQCARLLEQVRRAGHDEELLLALHALERALVQLDHAPVGAADDQ